MLKTKNQMSIVKILLDIKHDSFFMSHCFFFRRVLQEKALEMHHFK